MVLPRPVTDAEKAEIARQAAAVQAQRASGYWPTHMAITAAETAKRGTPSLIRPDMTLEEIATKAQDAGDEAARWAMKARQAGHALRSSTPLSEQWLDDFAEVERCVKFWRQARYSRDLWAEQHRRATEMIRLMSEKG